MPDPGFPVTVAVTRPDGSVEQVRVGTAIRRGDSFVLQLGELSVGSVPEQAPARRASPSPSYGGGGGGPSTSMVFPNYGRSKGAPIAGATVQDLEYYAAGARRSLGDASKSRFHDKERQLLVAIEAELARQGAGGPPGGHDDDEMPPRRDEDIPF